MAFLTKEEAQKSRTEGAKPLDLKPYIRIEKSVLVRELPFNSGLSLRGVEGEDPSEQRRNIIKVLADSVLDPATGLALTAEDLEEVFELTDLSNGPELLNKLQQLAFPKDPDAGN